MIELQCTNLMSLKHLEIHFLVQFRVIKDPHNDIHDLGLYGCEKVTPGKFAMFVLFHSVSQMLVSSASNEGCGYVDCIVAYYHV